MTTVLLVRHGETTWNRDRRVQGWAPTGLTDRGKQQAKRVAEAIATEYTVDRCIASDLRRTRETAETITETVSVEDLTFDRAWRERHFGVLQGLDYATIREEYPTIAFTGADQLDGTAAPEAGESLRELRDRVTGQLDALRDHGGTVLVVAHGGPIRQALGYLQELTPTESAATIEQANCAINELRLTPSTMTIVRQNETVNQ
ncbi:MAG: histidine phosphatase family protein [Halobacteriales archaeon]|nr:histidine phosphatase family protein [Halobacteriales archaeon]